MKDERVGVEDIEKIYKDHQMLAEAVKIDDDCILLKINDFSDPYEVPLDECATFGGILRWTTHLMQKTWVTKDYLLRFISLACSYHDLDVHRQ